MRGGKYLAEERGLFDSPSTPQAAEQAEAATAIARAPLYEVAATHDGQPAMAWLRKFYDTWNERQ